MPPWIELAIAGSLDALTQELRDSDVLLHVLQPVTAAMLDVSPRLRLIQKIGVGVNTIALDAARRKGIQVANMPGTNTQAVAEHTLMLMLAVLRKTRKLDDAVRAGKGWDLSPGEFDAIGEISGRCIGFVGFGEIPRRLAPVLSALGARVTYSMSKREAHGLAINVSLPELLRESDIVSLHLPLTDTTREIINCSALKTMKSHAILINTARGGLINQSDLVESLASGIIAGAGLDVMECEPCLADEPIARLNNVVLTPHVAWLTRETFERSLTVIAENCRRLRDGEPLLNLVT